jgi:hypothetical protein
MVSVQLFSVLYGKKFWSQYKDTVYRVLSTGLRASYPLSKGLQQFGGYPQYFLHVKGFVVLFNNYAKSSPLAPSSRRAHKPHTFSFV